MVLQRTHRCEACLGKKGGTPRDPWQLVTILHRNARIPRGMQAKDPQAKSL